MTERPTSTMTYTATILTRMNGASSSAPHAPGLAAHMLSLFRQLGEGGPSYSVASLVRYIRTRSITIEIFGALILALIHGIAWILKSGRARGRDIGIRCARIDCMFLLMLSRIQNGNVIVTSKPFILSEEVWKGSVGASSFYAIPRIIIRNR